MLTPELATATIQFLERIDLKPAEINAYVAVHQELSKIIKPEEVPRDAKPDKKT